MRAQNVIKPRKKKRRFTLVNTIVFVLFVLYTIILAIPYVWGIVVSLKTRYEYMEMPIFSMPKQPQFINYVKAWKELSVEGTSVPMMFLNSIWYAGGMSVTSIFFSTMTAYVIAKYVFPGRTTIHTTALVIMMLPIMGSMASSMKFSQMIGAYDSRLYILLNASSVGSIFIIMFATFKGVSWGYAEAAFIDGAGHFTVFFKIMLPQVISPLCALFMTQFITLWSDDATPLVYFPNLPTLSTGLYMYQSVVKKTEEYPIYFAGLITCMIPTLALFLIFQKNLMNVQMGGGLKG